MSHTRAIRFDDGQHVGLGPDAPAVYRSYAYGENLAAVWARVAALGRQLGLAGLDPYLCPQKNWLKVDDLEEELAEADPAEAEELRAKIAKLLPSHDPADILAVVEPMIAHLEAATDAPTVDLGEIVLIDLEAYALALKRAIAEGRRVFIQPF